MSRQLLSVKGDYIHEPNNKEHQPPQFFGPNFPPAGRNYIEATVPHLQVLVQLPSSVILPAIETISPSTIP